MNALHGGVDSRTLRPQGIGQDEQTVAEVILSVLSSTRSRDVYTKPDAKARIAAYLYGLTEDPPAVTPYKAPSTYM